MKSIARVLAIAVVASVLGSTAAQARDDRLKFPIADAATAAGTKVDDSVKLYWGDQPYPKNAKLMGTFTANKKTNFFNKSDKEGCQWVWLSAVNSLQERAKKEGGNAVVNIKSVYKNDEVSSTTEYECGAGALMGGVALKGTVANIP